VRLIKIWSLGQTRTVEGCEDKTEVVSSSMEGICNTYVRDNKQVLRVLYTNADGMFNKKPS